MTQRTIAIGDVHGCSGALRVLVDAIAPSENDTLVFLGDYIDRGEDSCGVIEQIIELQTRCRVVTLTGNHELMLLTVLRDGDETNRSLWYACGGEATVASYGGDVQQIPEQHIEFFNQCLPYWEDAENIYVHASYLPNVPLDELSEQYLYWEHLPPVVRLPHFSGKRVIVGHTPQANFQPLVLDHLVCLDTYCFGGGWLTAMDVGTGQFWQSSRDRRLRRSPVQTLAQGAKLAAHHLGKLWTRRIV